MEQDLIEQVRERVRALGITQEELARRAFGPDARRQNVSPYLTGNRGLLTSNGLKLLAALGLERLTVRWKDAGENA